MWNWYKYLCFRCKLPAMRARGKEVTCLQEVVNWINVWAIICFQIKSCKVDKSEFKIDGGEIEIVVKICLIDKDEFKDDDTSKY